MFALRVKKQMPFTVGKGATILFGLVIAVLLANAGVSYFNIRRLAENEHDVAHTYEELAGLERLMFLLNDAETGQRGYLLTGDAAYLEPYTEGVRQVSGQLDQLKELTADNAEQQSRFPALEEKIAAKLAELDETIRLRRDVGADAALRVVQTQVGKRSMDAIRQDVAVMEGTEKRLLEKRANVSAASFRANVGTFFLASVVALALVIAIFELIRRDLIGRHRAEEAERRQREWLEITLASIGDAVIATDAAGRVTFLNAIAESLTGWRRDEAAGKPLAEVFCIVNEQTRQPAEDPVAKVLQTGAVVGLANHTVLLAKDGGEVPVDDSAAPIKDESGTTLGVVLVFRDAGEQRRAEAALKDADRRKNDFLAALAHELRGPLGSVRNAVHALRLLNPSEPADATRARDIIDRQTSQMARLVDDLLDISRISQGKVTLHKEPVDLTAVVQQAVETCRPVIEPKRHDLTVSLPAEPVRLQADRARLVQVVTNLLTNAAKYTEAGGQIWLTAERHNGAIVLQVRDTGVGIPAELLPRLFEMFIQSDRTLARSEGGIGVGLAVVKTLVEMHGGKVEAQSEGPGRGSVFTVQLPLSRESER
jgi:PAS domain S-box-containing protein